jgi:tRNA pseudouridine13 synthase
LPRISGILKQQPDDFVVDEVPAYLPCGEGEFVYLHMQKTGLSGEQMVSLLAAALKIAHQDIGVAGLKDRQAITRQWISVPSKCEPLLSAIDHPGIEILDRRRHGNKLRAGHLRGNRFTIRVRTDEAAAAQTAAAIIPELQRRGFPNYYGEQRFGRDSETLRLGLDLLAGRATPADVPRARRKFLVRLAYSAVQSALFNALLSQRVLAGTVDRVLSGDVLQVVASGGCFRTEEIGVDQPRVDAGELVTAGPMFGPKMLLAADETAAAEDRLLADCGLSRDDFARSASLTPGARRPNVIRPADVQVQPDPAGLALRFTLPSGVYATTFLRELLSE